MRFVLPLRLVGTITVSEDPIASGIDASDRGRDLLALQDCRAAEVAAFQRHPCRKRRRQIARLSRAIDTVRAQLDVWEIHNA